MPELKFCADLMSQPCRAVCPFMKMNNIPYKDKGIKLHLGKQENVRRQTCCMQIKWIEYSSTWETFLVPFLIRKYSSQIRTCLSYLNIPSVDNASYISGLLSNTMYLNFTCACEQELSTLTISSEDWAVKIAPLVAVIFSCKIISRCRS